MLMRLLVMLVWVCGLGWGQSSSTPAKPGATAVTTAPVAGSIASRSGWPVAKGSDVDSVEHIVASVYDVISGPAGQARDWDRMRSLFVPDARLMPIQHVGDGGHTDVVMLTINGYIARSQARTTTAGFFERSVHNEVEEFGNLAQVWSTYESRHGAADAAPFARGINSFQLLKDGGRYWVVGILWDAERPGSAIPERYLGR